MAAPSFNPNIARSYVERDRPTEEHAGMTLVQARHWFILVALTLALFGAEALTAEPEWAASTDDRVCRHNGHPRGTWLYDLCRRTLAQKRAESAPVKTTDPGALLDQQDKRVCRLKNNFLDRLHCKEERAAARRKGVARPFTKAEEDQLRAEEERRRYFTWYGCYVEQQFSRDRYRLACGTGLTTSVDVACTGVECPEAEEEADRVKKAKP